MKFACWLFITALMLSAAFPIRAQTTCNETDASVLYDDIATKYIEEDYEGVIADATCALELEINPEDQAWVLFYRGSAYERLLDYDNAETDLLAVLELAPDDSATLNNLGNVYYGRADYQTAIDFYGQAVEADNQEREVPYYNRGIAYYELGEYDLAIENLNESISSNADYSYPYLMLGSTYQVLGDPQNDYFVQWLEMTETERIERQKFGGLEEETLLMAEGLVYSIPFDAIEGQDIFIAAQTEDDLDPLLVLLDPAGNPVAADDDSGINLNAVITDFTAPEDGTYTLLLGQAGLVGEGDATLTLNVGGESSRVFSVYDLIVGRPVRVFTTAGDTLNLRGGPGLSFDIIEQLNSGTSVTLLEGPRKADGYAWWRIETADGVTGWAVERADTEQTLQPALIIGEEAIVFTDSGDRLNVRSEAGRDNELVTQLENGSIVTILEGPVELEDLTWWKIRTSDGVEGWAVDRVSDEQTLVGKPAKAE